MEIRPTQSPKKVMVVGGGPGGLHVAWIAAVRGHDVHLYEKASALGGQLILGSVSTFKKELLSLIEFHIKQVAKSGVKTHLNFEVTPETIQREKPDVVVLSTGSLPVKPPIPGVDSAIVCELPEVLNGQGPVRLKTVVVGGGATGCEVAHHLAENGCPVTIVEQLPKLAPQLESITRKVLLKKLKDFQVSFKTGHRLSRIESNGVRVTSADGKELFVEADAVVLAIGNRPDNTLYEQVKSFGIPLYQIGDCLEPRSAKAAISEGAAIGRAI